VKKKLLLALCGFVAFAAGYGAVAYAYPSGGVFGRAANRGYFTNSLDSSGWEVLNTSCSASGEYGPYNYNSGSSWCNAIPRDLNTPAEFFAFIEGRLANGVPNGSYGFGSGTYGDTRARTGAAFIVHTMLGTPDGQRSRPPSAAQMTAWRDLVNQYSAASRINWSTGAHSYNLNSYFQATDDSPSPNDDAFYDSNRSGLAIVFYNASGGIEYAIRRECANPVGQGNIGGLDPITNWAASGRSTVSNAVATPGSTLTFNHYVRNNGPTSTGSYEIWSATLSHPSDATLTGGHNTGAYSSGQEKLVDTRNVVVPINSPPGTQICEKVLFDHQSSSVPSPAIGTPVCATVPYNYNLTPTINATITSGGAPITGNVAEPGDTITFTYSVNNPAGNTESQSVACTYRQQTWPGYNQTAPTIAFTPAGSYCPPNRVFPGNSNTTTATETVAAAAANTTICRNFTITPSSHSGGTATTAPSCVLVATKPYARVWGGDISAGNGLANSSGVCTTNNNGAIVGWNRRAPGSNSGAGVQYAAFALARVTDFATALYDPGGAPSPNGLSFANTSGNAANGDFGGSFGSAPCIPDYYATRPTPTLAIPATVAAMVTGVYGGTGNFTLGGGSIVNPNNRITVYVDGNVMINGNITYSGSWDTNSVPLFEMIVRGNIYIDNDVTQLDGVYVAQPNGSGVGGEIHTCSTTSNGFAALPLNSLYANCTRKLTVNGLFTARQIRLLRTIGTLGLSNTSEASTSGNVAETFNYGPAVWMSQPARQSQGSTPDYDAIISLPPVL